MLSILEVTFSDVVYVGVCTFLTVILIGVLRHTINLAHASKPPSKDVTTQCELEDESGTSSNARSKACSDPVANGRPGSKVFSIKCNGDCRHVESAPPVDAAEIDKLKRHVVSLERELEASKATINNLKQSEQQLRNRLSDQIRRQFESGGAATNGDGVGKELGYRFEDINQDETSRPTLLIRRYNDLYSDARVDTLDALDDVRLNIGGSDDEADQLKNNILLTCIVLAFHHADKEIRLIRDNVFNTLMGQQVATKHSQSIPTDGTNKPSLRSTIDNTVSTLILKTSKHRQTAADVEAILDSLMTSPLCRRCPTLRQNQQLSTFISTCFQLAWSLSALNPPYCIRYDTIEKSMTSFDPDLHVRYHTSDADSLSIKSVVWPQLAERDSGKCVAKAVVIT